MSAPSALVRQFVIHRQPGRRVSTSSPRRRPTSPQRRDCAPGPRARRFTDIPGPLALPMLRHSAYVLPRIGNFHHSVGLGLLEGLRDRYGNLVRLAKASRKRPVLYVFDPELMKEVYDSKATEPPHWEGSPLHQQRKSTGNQSSLQSDETKEIWASIRSLLREGTLRKNFEQVFDDIAADFTRRLGELRHLENALNEEICTEVHRWALESIGVMVFGIRLGCLDGPAHVPGSDHSRRREKTCMEDDTPETCSLWRRREEGLTAGERLARCTLQLASGGGGVRGEHTLRTDSRAFAAAVRAFDTHYTLTEHFLLQAVQSLNTSELRPEQVLIDKLKSLQSRVLPVAADILLAGVDPLAHTMLGVFYQLSLHAAQQQRAHDHVAWSVASREAGADCTELPYIDACVREALRLYPVTGGVVRRSMEDLLVGGYEVPAGVDIVLAHGVASKDEKQWGRARSFVPERWCAEGWEPLRASRAHPAASRPFGEACPASEIVGGMAAALVARVMARYRLEWHGPPPSVHTVSVNKLQPPFYFVLQDAS